MFSSAAIENELSGEPVVTVRGLLYCPVVEPTTHGGFIVSDEILVRVNRFQVVSLRTVEDKPAFAALYQVLLLVKGE